MAAFEEEKGLVGRILQSTESSSFDLAGFTEGRCKELIEKAFRHPLVCCDEMIKFTFTIGGGKLVRSRYDESMPKWIVTALKDIDFVEDRSAACDFQCQGTFKQQHDTGQNLKTVTIFPFVACANNKSHQEEEVTDQGKWTISPQDAAIITADFATFCEIINDKTVSWSQRKRALTVLITSDKKLQSIESKMMRGDKLESIEQEFYDNFSGGNAEKISWLQSEIKAMVDKGRLTQDEKLQLLRSIEENISALDEEYKNESLNTDNVNAKLYNNRREKMQLRHSSVQSIIPIIHELKNSEDIFNIYVSLHYINILQEKGRSMSLTLSDLKKMEPKNDLEQNLIQLQLKSRCWFETDNEFDKRCSENADAAKSKINSSSKYSSKTALNKKSGKSDQNHTQGVSSSSHSWNTKKTKAISGRHSGNVLGGGNKRRNDTTQGGFAAAFGYDSDSD